MIDTSSKGLMVEMKKQVEGGEIELPNLSEVCVSNKRVTEPVLLWRFNDRAHYSPSVFRVQEGLQVQ